MNKFYKSLLAAALAFAAFAQGPAEPSRRNPFQVGGVNPILRAALNPKIAEKIGLTEEQQTKLKALATDKDSAKDITVA